MHHVDVSLQCYGGQCQAPHDQTLVGCCGGVGYHVIPASCCQLSVDKLTCVSDAGYAKYFKWGTKLTYFALAHDLLSKGKCQWAFNHRYFLLCSNWARILSNSLICCLSYCFSSKFDFLK